jgi:isoleucyl-tRNA synthetase
MKKGEKEILSFDEKIVVKRAEKEQNYYFLEELKVLTDIVVTFNNKKNFDFLVKNWAEFVNKNTTIYFVNLTKNSYWAIKPSHHEKICDKKTLKQGLKALYESSEIIN